MALNIQNYYQCNTCKAALDIYGRSCKHGLLFPIGLILANRTSCPNYEFDAEKVKYSERGSITSVGGIPHTKGGRKMFLEEILKVARLGTMRYWNLRNKGGNND